MLDVMLVDLISAGCTYHCRLDDGLALRNVVAAPRLPEKVHLINSVSRIDEECDASAGGYLMECCS